MAGFRVKDTSRSLCYPVYVVIVFHLVKQTPSPWASCYTLLGPTLPVLHSELMERYRYYCATNTNKVTINLKNPW